jgi:hypothetical protein
MKKLFFLFMIAFATTLGYAQEVPEKASSIVITLTDSITAADKVKKAFADREFEIAKAGKDASIITTVGRTLKNGARVGYTAQLKGKDVILTGRMLVAGQSGMAISYVGKKGTPIMNGWEEMDKIAKLVGGKITYK